MLLMYRALTGLGYTRNHIAKLRDSGEIKAKKNAKGKWIIDFEEYDYARQVSEMPTLSQFVSDYKSTEYQSFCYLCKTGVINAKKIFGKYRLYEDGVKTINKYISGKTVTELAKELGMTYQAVNNMVRTRINPTKIGKRNIILKDDVDFIKEFYSSKTVLQYSKETGVYYKKVREKIKKGKIDIIKLGKSIRIKDC